MPRKRPSITVPQLCLSDVLYALSDPVRLEIVKQIEQAGNLCCGQLDVQMPKSTLSHHFRILRESGVVGTESQGTFLVNHIRKEALESQYPGLLDCILASSRSEEQPEPQAKQERPIKQ